MMSEACNFIKKETQSQAFFHEVFEILKNTIFHRTPSVAASDFQCPLQNFKKKTLYLLFVFQYTDRIEQNTVEKFYQTKKKNNYIKSNLTTKDN